MNIWACFVFVYFQYQTTSPAKLIMLDSYQSDIPSTGTAI